MRNRWSVFLAAYFPLFCFRRAERPSFNTLLGSTPISFDALRSEMRPDLIFEMICPTESQVSWNCFDREKYCRAVVGTALRRILILRRTARFRFLRLDFILILRFIDSTLP